MERKRLKFLKKISTSFGLPKEIIFKKTKKRGALWILTWK